MISCKMRLLVLFACVGVALSQLYNFDKTLDSEWETWKNFHGKSYRTSNEESYRRAIWEDRLQWIAKHNREYDMGLHTYSVGSNQFNDMTEAEVASITSCYVMSQNETGSLYLPPSDQKLAATVDWRTKGYVTGVKTQGINGHHCGSCWAFSTTGSVEGQHKRATGKLVSLSEQQLVDCSQSYDNHGCEGGNMDKAFKYIAANGGIDTESSYPYTAQDGTCHFSKSDVGATIKGYTALPRGSEIALSSALSSVGPISVGIDGRHTSFHHYRDGIYYNPACSSTELHHGVLAVGYGSNYYIVKNSWGPNWGKQGYVLMSRNRGNNCGIATAASYPNV
ncbi:cathepsin L1 isoform X1 [Lingula anatina]|uniref:Cathepsin L1 isoform X1 n=1 Tax=Lingula anatina TaxID=7574 RepID=A0A1S3JPP9_LINAN|nr:cathepsin L1 isoform X1 [Lingula anatina]|eukprot:XP_013412350.1 cathepsin L1 isoform X1 [Lingula anatina]